LDVHQLAKRVQEGKGRQEDSNFGDDDSYSKQREEECHDWIEIRFYPAVP
jgi:hypothetical protein